MIRILGENCATLTWNKVEEAIERVEKKVKWNSIKVLQKRALLWSEREKNMAFEENYWERQVISHKQAHRYLSMSWEPVFPISHCCSMHLSVEC